jgi:signal peptidase II
LGGAIGNMIDRVVIGCVRDFIDATFVETLTGYAFPVFNFADICVCVGVAILAYYILFIHDKIYKVEKDAKDNG